MHAYFNPWVPERVKAILAAEAGPILDVGGGASPYGGAGHVIDIIPFDAERLKQNAWGASPKGWTRTDYTEADIVAGGRWPFADQQFAIGLCSHTLEDLRDPLPALAEMGRVCRTLLILAPSRLLEQTKGIDSPRRFGFAHHPWMISQDDRGLVFRRKTQYLQYAGCHMTCPLGKTFRVDDGTFVYHGPAVAGREAAFWSQDDELDDLRRFLDPFHGRSDLFIRDTRPMTWRRRVYYWRQKYWGVP